MRLCCRLAQKASAASSSSSPALTQSPPPNPSAKFPSLESVVNTRKNKLNPGLNTYYRQPLYITQGSMQHLWDDKGKK
jgi:alanine-glyoxylate transaminase/(R)-3-amino-2-methylpropionate-pyruvate transaminase